MALERSIACTERRYGKTDLVPLGGYSEYLFAANAPFHHPTHGAGIDLYWKVQGGFPALGSRVAGGTLADCRGRLN